MRPFLRLLAASITLFGLTFSGSPLAAQSAPVDEGFEGAVGGVATTDERLRVGVYESPARYCGDVAPRRGIRGGRRVAPLSARPFQSTGPHPKRRRSECLPPAPRAAPEPGLKNFKLRSSLASSLVKHANTLLRQHSPQVTDTLKGTRYVHALRVYCSCPSAWLGLQ